MMPNPPPATTRKTTIPHPMVEMVFCVWSDRDEKNVLEMTERGSRNGPAVTCSAFSYHANVTP